jgi:hypothetical protein
MMIAILMPKYNITYHFFFNSIALIGNYGYILELSRAEFLLVPIIAEISNVTRVYYEINNIVLRFIAVLAL